MLLIVHQSFLMMLSLDTVILLWTLYCTKHRNWFHESLMMIEIFTKLPLKIQKFWLLYRQAVRNSLKLGISCSDNISRNQTSKFLNGSLVNISNITRLSWNQFRCLMQYSVHKRLTVFSEQVQDKNKQMFVVNKFRIE